MPGQHACLSPSGAKRWVSCPPSARLNQKYLERFGEKSSEFAEEGTKAHTLSELKLRLENGEINKFNYEEQRKMLGDISSEMDTMTDRYVDAVLEEYYTEKNRDNETYLLIEQRLDISRWIPQCFGTSDAVIVNNLGLIVIDLKYGKGVPVVAENNYQGRIYALGALQKFSALDSNEGTDDTMFTFRHVKTKFVQPRLDTITEEILTCEELLEWGEWLRPYADLAWKGKGEFAVGEHCRFCNIKGLCRKRLEGLLELTSNGFDSPEVMTDDMVAGILPYLDDVESYCKDIRAYARSAVLNGGEIRGYKLVKGKRPSRVWRSEDAVIDQLSRAGYTEDQYCSPKKLKSVAEMEKMMGKSAFTAIVGGLTFQGEGAPTLVPISDKREPYASLEADFADLVDAKESE